MKPYVPVLLLLVSFPLFAQTLTEEVPLTRDELRAAPSVRQNPFVASDGTGFFAVWTDLRSSNADVYGARFDASGTLLDPAGIPVAPTYLADAAAGVVWNGRNYAVLSATDYAGLHIVEVSREGLVAGGGNVGGPRNVNAAGFAWSGTHYLVVYATYDGTNNVIRAMLVDRDLQVVRDGIAIDEGLDAAVASNGSEFLVVTRAAGGLRVTTVSTAGEASAPAAISTSSQLAFSIASDGIGYAITSGYGPGAELLIVNSRRELVRRAPLGDVRIPRLVWDGTHYVAAWARDGGIDGARIDANGNIGEVVPLVSSASAVPALAVGGSRVLLICSEANQIYGAPFERAAFPRGATSEPSLVSYGLPYQAPLDVLWANGSLATLIAESSNVSELFFDYRGLRTSLGQASSARMAFNGTTFAVTTAYNSVAQVHLIDTFGQRLGGLINFPLPFTNAAPIASNGRDFLTLFVSSGALHTAALSRDGAFGTPRLVAPAEARIRYAPGAIVWTGSEYVAAVLRSEVERFGSRELTIATEVVLHRFDTDGNPVAAPQSLAYVAGNTGPIQDVGVATSGRDLLVVWSAFGQGVRARRVALDGTAEAAVTLRPRGAFPDVSWDGRAYVIVSQEEASPDTASRRLVVQRYGDVAEQSFLIPTPFPTALVATASSAGRTAIVYDRVVPLVPGAHAGGPRRAFVRFFATLRGRVVGR
jgi:hypothetical protein